jgi:hypothetical protein
MNKEQLKVRLINLKQLKSQHEQDIFELAYCIDGLTKQIESMPDEKIEEVSISQ